MTNSPSSAAHAIGGYDAVAYFEDGRAVEGRAEHAVEHAGGTWLFVSEGHAAAFRAAPQKYMPAYHGHCAFGASFGQKEPGDPRHWAVRNGRLFLNSNRIVHQLWKLLPGRIAAADKKWGK